MFECWVFKCSVILGVVEPLGWKAWQAEVGCMIQVFKVVTQLWFWSQLYFRPSHLCLSQSCPSCHDYPVIHRHSGPKKQDSTLLKAAQVFSHWNVKPSSLILNPSHRAFTYILQIMKYPSLTLTSISFSSIFSLLVKDYFICMLHTHISISEINFIHLLLPPLLPLSHLCWI